MENAKVRNNKKGYLYILFILVISFTLWKFSQSPWLKNYEISDLTNNYDKYEIEIRDFINYFRSIVPDDSYVYIEPANRRIDIFFLKDDMVYREWNMNLNSKKADTIFNILHWNKKEIKKLKEKLDKINCISIDNSDPVRIGFKRSGFGKYYYLVFEKSIAENDSLMEIYNNNCTEIYYRDNVVLEYGCGAIGNYCFPKSFINNH